MGKEGRKERGRKEEERGKEEGRTGERVPRLGLQQPVVLSLRVPAAIVSKGLEEGLHLSCTAPALVRRLTSVGPSSPYFTKAAPGLC